MTYTREQQAENRRLWVEALRSGRYRQGRMALTKLADHHRPDDHVTHCCLGVACEVAVESGLDLAVEDDTVGGVRRYDDRTAELPDPVRAWLGLGSRLGALSEPVVMPGLSDTAETLAVANDAGMPFADIADLIEQGKVKVA